MPDAFQGSGSITLYAGDANVPINLRFPTASGSTKNDGAVPYGSTIYSYTVTAKYYDDNSSSTALIGDVTASGNQVTVYLQHSTTVPVGLHYLYATVTWTLSGTTLRMTRPFDLDRIYVK